MRTEPDYDKMKPVTFVVAFTVHPTWIADGFTLTDERAKHMLAMEVGGAYNHEIAARVIHVGSSLDYVFRLQGYEGKKRRLEVEEYKTATPLWNELRRRLKWLNVSLTNGTGLKTFADLLSPGRVPQEEL